MTPPTPIDVARISRAWRSLNSYRPLSLQVFDTQATLYSQLAPLPQSLLPHVPIRLSHAAEAIEHNADILERVAQLAAMPKPFDPSALSEEQLAQAVADFPDVVDGLLALVRDWSGDSEKEREKVLGPILRAVEEAAGDAVASGAVERQEDFSVLVPGAGLGRLAWEVARRGFFVQGVEASYVLLLLCNFVLNGQANVDKPLHIYPYAHHTGMVVGLNEQCAEVRFPDVKPREVKSGNFGMVAGEFLEVCDGNEGRWDCVVTCFHVENCHSIISVVRRVAEVLRSGGVWINLGGLDYRFEDSQTEPCIELTAEELDLVMVRSGFRVVKREWVTCKPPFAPGGMIEEEVDATFTVAVKL